MRDSWLLPDYDLLPRLKSLRIPTLVISGDHEFIPAAAAEHIAHAIPNARMVTLKGCGHFSYLECPIAVRKQIDTLFAGTIRPLTCSEPPMGRLLRLQVKSIIHSSRTQCVRTQRRFGAELVLGRSQ